MLASLPRNALAALIAAVVLCSAAPAAFGEARFDSPPPGANDFNCKPGKAHPRAVVLVHGLGATMGENWGMMSPLLKGTGYCVFALTYGVNPAYPQFGGVLPIEDSAKELKSFVGKVLRRTGTKKVDLLGHSEGTFMPQYWLKYLGGAKRVKRYVAMTPLYDGTTLAGLNSIRDIGSILGISDAAVDAVAQYCGSCPEFLHGSPMVRQLRKGGAAVRGVRYTTIPTKYDELVQPWQSGLLNAPNAVNRVLQDVCPTDLSEHLAEAFDPVVGQLITNALDPANSKPVSCGVLPPAF